VKSIIHATSQDSSASIVNRLQTGRIRVVPFPTEALPSLGPNSLNLMDTAILSTEPDAAHSPPSRAVVSQWLCNSCLPYLCMICTGTNYPFNLLRFSTLSPRSSSPLLCSFFSSSHILYAQRFGKYEV